MKLSTLDYIKYGLIILVAGILGAMIKGFFTPPCQQITTNTIEIPFDTTAFKAKLKPVIIQNWKDTGSIKYVDYDVLVPFQISLTAEDTARILHAYWETLQGKDTIVNNPELFFELSHSITQNRLVGYEGRYFWKKPQTITTNTISNPATNQLYIGTSFGANFKDGFIVQGRITLKTKKDALWGVSVDYMPFLSKRPMFSLSHDFKIKL